MRTLSPTTLEAIGRLVMCNGVGDGKGTACIAYQQAIAEALEAGKPWPEPTDSVLGVSKLLNQMEIRANDRNWWASDEERTATLREFVPLLMGTAGSDALEWRRIWRSIDWALREELPTLLPECASALALDLALDRALALALDRALDLDRDRALDLDRDRALAARGRYLALLRELAMMEETS